MGYDHDMLRRCWASMTFLQMLLDELGQTERLRLAPGMSAHGAYASFARRLTSSNDSPSSNLNVRPGCLAHPFFSPPNGWRSAEIISVSTPATSFSRIQLTLTEVLFSEQRGNGEPGLGFRLIPFNLLGLRWIQYGTISSIIANNIPSIRREVSQTHILHRPLWT